MATGKKILIVEDEEAILQPISEDFQDKGFDVVVARNGEEGLAVALKEKPDIVMLDLNMPVMDGVTMLKKLRSEPAGRAMKVIVMTNFSGSDKASETAGLGVLDYIVKSDWKLKDIVSRVSEKLGL